MNPSLRIAIVGCGQIADGHVEEIQKLSCAQLEAVCDLEPILAEQLATRYDVPRYFSNFEQMLSEIEPHVVHVCTPPASHLDLVRASLKHDAHVYVEKPLAATFTEAEAMVAEVRKAGKKMTIGHIHHFDPIAIRARQMVVDGDIGEVVHVESWFGYNLSGSFGKLILGSPDHWVHRLPGGLLQNNINHLLHKITEYIPDAEPSVHALGWRSASNRHWGDARDHLYDELRVTINGEAVSGQGTFTSKAGPVAQTQRIFGSNGTLHLDYNNRMLVLDRGVVLPSAIGRLTSGWTHARRAMVSALRNSWHFSRNRFHYFAGMNELIARFYQSILDGSPAPISEDEILRISKIMDEIFAQIRQESQ